MNPKNIFLTVLSVAGVGVILTMAGMAAMWWISVEVAGQLQSAGIVPVAKVDALNTRVENLESLHEKDTNRIETKAEKIAEILMND
ncbi:MAG TPA: hypothetical protein PKH39_17810 [Woeseiaceae bacterium]|nr:hypothetical protein [Woeseiaceae bacterium]